MRGDSVPLLRTAAAVGHCVLTLWTDDPALAAEADASGIDRIGPDFERLHKARRQQGLGYRLSEHRIEQLPAIRAALNSAQLFVRTNPVNDDSAREVELMLAAGVQVLMLPMPVAPDLVYAQHARLGGSAALVARSFLALGGDLAAEVLRARERLDYWRGRDDAELQAATEALRACTAN